jgi:hypothetical protein
MTNADSLVEMFTDAGWKFVECRRVANQPFTFVIFSDFAIPYGRLCGQVARLVAIAVPDDQMLPPPGIHTYPDFSMIGWSSVHASPLGDGWAYWSRPIPNFLPTQGPGRVLAHVHTIFRDA